MKRIFSILFALVLVVSFSLIPAAPVMATGTTTTLSIPDNVYRPAPFDVSGTTTNDGTAYTNVRFNITVSGPEAFTGAREDIFTITQVVPGGVQGINETFMLVGGDFVGYWGPASGFPLPASYSATSTFTIQMNDGGTAPVGNYQVTVELVDLTPDPDVTLASATDGFSLSADTLHVGAGQQFTTIQAAIDAANSGDTIIVADGTYIENIIINKSLTLQAASSPVIDGEGMLGPGVHITATNVTFRGFTVTDFTCTPNSGIGAILVEGDGAIIDDNIIYDIRTQLDPIANPAGIGIDVHASNVEVTNNTVHDVGSIGIRVRHDWDTAPTVSNNVLLENNEVYRTANTGVLVTGYAKGVTIRENEIHESLLPTPYNLFVHYGAEDVVIQRNTIRDPFASIYGHNVVLAGCKDVNIIRNTIIGATLGKNIYVLSDYGPWVDAELLSTNIHIVNNDIQNGAWGVRLVKTLATDASQMAATTTIHANNISGNTIYGVQNLIATDVNARSNWWDAASGPSGVGPGTGDAVSGNVLYKPWRKKALP